MSSVVASAASVATPLPPLRWHLNAADIKSEGEALIAEMTAVLDTVAAASPVTFESVVEPLLRLDRDLEVRVPQNIGIRTRHRV